MDIATFLSTFGLIFLAELGDKTQLTAMALAVRFPWKKVFFGIALAFVVLNLGAVVIGKVLFALLPLFWITILSAALFLYFGVTTLIQSCASADEEPPPDSQSHIIKTVFVMMVMAELGDKTQLITASQAAQHSATFSAAGGVFVASTLALWSVSLLGIFIGRQLIKYVPLCWIHRSAGVMFIIFGLVIASRLFMVS